MRKRCELISSCEYSTIQNDATCCLSIRRVICTCNYYYRHYSIPLSLSLCASYQKMSDITNSVSEFSSPLLISLSTFILKFQSIPFLNSSLFPAISILTLLHATRVSHASFSLSPDSTPILQSTALTLILLFGGTTLSALLLSIPSPILTSGKTIAIYSITSICLNISGINTILSRISRKKKAGLALDIGFHLIDGICRSEGIVLLGVEAVRNHPDEIIADSTFAVSTVE